MKSKIVLAGLTALLVLVLASPARLKAAGDGDHYYFGFENGDQALASWKAASDTPAATSLLNIISGENGCADMLGSHYALLKSTSTLSRLDDAVAPRADNPPGPASTVVPYPVGSWALTSVPAGGRTIVKISFNAKGGGDCAGCTPLVYVGTAPPNSIGQFTPADGADYLKEYWQTFDHNDILFEGVLSTIYVALGLQGVNASMGLDCINIDVTSIE